MQNHDSHASSLAALPTGVDQDALRAGPEQVELPTIKLLYANRWGHMTRKRDPIERVSERINTTPFMPHFPTPPPLTLALPKHRLPLAAHLGRALARSRLLSAPWELSVR